MTITQETINTLQPIISNYFGAKFEVQIAKKPIYENNTIYIFAQLPVVLGQFDKEASNVSKIATAIKEALEETEIVKQLNIELVKEKKKYEEFELQATYTLNELQKYKDYYDMQFHMQHGKRKTDV